MMVVPGATLVTTPEFMSIVATPVLLLVHWPPLFPLEFKLMADPMHTEDPPLIVPALSTGLIVIGADADAVPHRVVTE